MQIAFILFAAALFQMMHLIKPQSGSQMAPVVYQAIAAVAVADGFIGIWMKRLLLKARLRPQPDGRVPTVAQQWLFANVIRTAFAMSTCLFGFVLHTLAAPERLAQALVALGILYLLVSPGKPPTEPVSSHQSIANS